jgi:hypothetical protein
MLEKGLPLNDLFAVFEPPKGNYEKRGDGNGK